MTRASVALLALPIVLCVPARAAALYECADAQGRRSYGYEPCAGGAAIEIAIDRASPATSSETGAPRDVRSESAPHRLSGDERERIARLRREERAAPRELQVATEIEIAAIREGADAQLSAKDRASLGTLRSRLASSEAAAREDALAKWQAIYARYREPAHPRVQPAPPPLGTGRDATAGNAPSSPLMTPVPGTQGPLAATPNVQSGAATRPPFVTDPFTGRVLTPTDNGRAVDPLTGTMWMRSGRSYVDPATGRVIPAP